MVEKTAKRRRTQRTVLYVLGAILLIALLALFCLWNRYVNKNSLLAEFCTPQGQEVYILGTLHKEHFSPLASYSMEDVLSAVKNTKPDEVFIEARKETFEETGAIDGPVDMCVVYAYCIENHIPVRLIDWWVIDNDFKENSTNDQRDDNMFKNIAAELEDVSSGSRVLVVCGSGHFCEQEKRFKAAGFEKQKLSGKAALFDSGSTAFAYPEGAAEIWRQRAYFYAYINSAQVEARSDLSEEVKAGFTGWDRDKFYDEQLEYCKMFEENRLYN